MECSNCGSYRHNSSSCPDFRDEETGINEAFEKWWPDYCSGIDVAGHICTCPACIIAAKYK